MSFKFFSGKQGFFTHLEPTQLLTLTRPVVINNVEFCFQFDNEEPVVFASGPNDCQINLSPQTDANVTFNNNGRVFKLFARERQ